MRQSNGFGIFLMVVGTWWLAREFGLIPMEVGQIIRAYWPFALIFVGVLEVIKGNLHTAFFWIIIGAVFQLSRVFNTSAWDVLWPTLIIWFGLSITMGKKPYATKVEEERSEKRIKETVLFGPLELKITSKDFEGGSVECIFAGGTLDLSEATIVDGSKLEVTAVFGGLEVIAPKKALVDVRGTSVMGGFSNKLLARGGKLPKLMITGNAIFGGVEVKE